jgi:hypothetical protein
MHGALKATAGALHRTRVAVSHPGAARLDYDQSNQYHTHNQHRNKEGEFH